MMTYNLRTTNSAQVTFRFPESLKGTLGEDSVVHIYAEVLDKYGANYEFEAYTVTLRPAIYAIYPHQIADITLTPNSSMYGMFISLEDAFTWKTPLNANKTVFTKSVKENTNTDLVTATLDANNNDLLMLYFAKDKTGVADITIEQTATRQDNTWSPVYTRSATNTFRVTIQSTPTDVDDMDADANDGLVVYPNPVVDHLNVNLPEAGTVRIYDLSGKCVAQVVGHAGINTIRTSSWANGVYVIKFADLTAKVVK